MLSRFHVFHFTLSLDRESSSTRFVFARPLGGPILGVVHPMSKYSVANLRATCRQHPACRCWITAKHADDDIAEGLARDLAVWLSEADRVTELDHWNSSISLRRRYGVNVRKVNKYALG